MKNVVRYFPSALCLFLILFFTSTVSASDKPKKIKSGVYGCCSCVVGEKNQIIELTLNQDQTFTYTDNSVSAKKITLTGTWKENGEKIYLTSSDGRKSFHRKWKLVAEGKCIRSRYKLNFRRICAPQPC